MTFKDLIQHLDEAFKAQMPFAVYCLPDQEEVVAMIQKDRELHIPKAKESGFLMTSFLTDRHLIIPLENSAHYTAELNEDAFELEEFDGSLNKLDQSEYQELIEKALDAIEQERFSKVVLSRKYEQSLTRFDLGALVVRLMRSYKNTMRYLWYHPETGIWCGATPEVLIEVWGNTFKTMALAGTKPFHEIHSPQWTAKELAEQRYVKDAIGDRISKYTSLLKVSKTENHRAGKLVHLKTRFSGVMHKQKNIDEMIDVLHPTPAICGTPTKIAKEFIVSNEGYDRSFYTGYLGPRCQLSKETKLFVNLRCMHIDQGVGTLYAGGGITDGSVPKDEWEETQTKLKTMLDVLAPFL